MKDIDERITTMLAKLKKYGGILKRKLVSSESKGPHFTDEKSLFKIDLKHVVKYKASFNNTKLTKHYCCEFATEKGASKWYLNNVIK